MHLDTCFQFSNFLGQMNGEVVDSLIYSLYAYFKTCLDMVEEVNLQIANVQLEGMTQS